MIAVHRWIPIVAPPLLATPPALPMPASFSGGRREFLALAARGAMLEFITLGFYRFWLATDIRRHLWSNTQVDGDAAEYTGRGNELLIGFLFALAVLVPVYLAYFLIGIEVEHLRAFASFPLFLFFYLFGQFAIYRARRYRLTRTVWRGVRFWMDGSGWVYALRAAWWTVLAIGTIGILLPWRAAALERYKMRHCYYGELQGSFEGRGSDFFKRGWWLWLLAVALVAGPPTVIDIANLAHRTLPNPVTQALSVSWLLVLPAAPFIYAVFKAIEWRWWLSGVRFGKARLESTLMRGALAPLYWKVVGCFLLTAALFAAYLLACAWSVAAINKMPMSDFAKVGYFQGNVSMLVLSGIGYLAFILVMNLLWRIYLVRDLWARIASSTTLLDADAIENVWAEGSPAGALGEGLADSLDVVGF
jgi:uncharacterized membrane protein YjgN (DUF898 family)